MNISRVQSLLSLLVSSAALALTLGIAGCSNSNDVLFDTVATRNDGIRQYTAGDYTGAASTFKATLRNTPSDYGSHYFLGACLARMGSYESAIEQYKTTLVLMNTDLIGKTDKVFRVQCLNSLAEAVVASKDRDVQSALVAGAPAYESQFLMAKIDRGLGDADAALAAYSQASLLAPTDFDVAKDYGLYLLQLSQTEKARTELRRAYTLNNTDPQLADALRRVGVVPGPSLKNEKDMVKPAVPVGPIPEVELALPASGQKTGDGQ